MQWIFFICQVWICHQPSPHRRLLRLNFLSGTFWFYFLVSLHWNQSKPFWMLISKRHFVSSAGRGFVFGFWTLTFGESIFKSLGRPDQTLLEHWHWQFWVSLQNLLFLNMRDSFLLPELLRALWLLFFMKKKDGWVLASPASHCSSVVSLNPFTFSRDYCKEKIQKLFL